jgi:hypothetical protein
MSSISSTATIARTPLASLRALDLGALLLLRPART